MQKTMVFNDVTINSVKWNNYNRPFWYVSKDTSVNLF